MANRNKRTTLPLRPWVKRSGVYDRLTSNRCAHVDLYAHLHEGVYYFAVAYGIGGKRVDFRHAWRWDGADGFSQADHRTVQFYPEIYWTREHAHAFNRVHKWLIGNSRFVGMHLQNRQGERVGYVSLHCHYVRVPDGSPWPRGFVNLYGSDEHRVRVADVRRRNAELARARLGITPRNSLPDVL